MGIIPEKAIDTWVDDGAEDKALAAPVEETPADPGYNPDEPADPAEKANFEKPAEHAEKPAATEDPPEGEQDDKAILAELTRVLTEVDDKIDSIKAEAKAAKPAEEPTERKVNPALKALLDHDDVLVRETAEKVIEAYNELEDRTAALESKRREDEFARVTVEVQTEIDAVQNGYGLTNEEINAVTDYMTVDRPGLAQTVSFEEGMLMKYPGRQKATAKHADPGTVVKVPGKKPETGTVVDRPGNAGVTPKTAKVPASETMEQAVARGFSDLGGG